MRIAALITCHNRKKQTLACLDALFENTLPEGFFLDVYLVDDGSSDGTDAAVREQFTNVEILHGDGNLYWNRGMHLAFARAMGIGFDCYLWLNDDTVLYPTAIKSLVRTWQEKQGNGGRGDIVVGSTQDPHTGALTYGGMVANGRLLPYRSLVEPQSIPIECQTMNGNCVLVSHAVAQVVGNLEPRFVHAMGDVDYGLRAKQAGFNLWIAPYFVGTCCKNSINGTYKDQALPLRIRWQKMMQPNGLPPASWLLFTYRHGGILWPAFFVWPYLRVLF